MINNRLKLIKQSIVDIDRCDKKGKFNIKIDFFRRLSHAWIYVAMSKRRLRYHFAFHPPSPCSMLWKQSHSLFLPLWRINRIEMTEWVSDVELKLICKKKSAVFVQRKLCCRELSFRYRNTCFLINSTLWVSVLWILFAPRSTRKIISIAEV